MITFLKSQNQDILLIIGLIFSLLISASLTIFILGKTNKNLKLEELKSRTKSWWIMASLFVAATVFVSEITYIAFALLSFVALRELFSILDLRSTDRRTMFWAYLAIPVQYYLAYIGWYGAFIIFIPVVLFLILPFRLALTGEMKGQIKSMATIQWALMLTVFAPSHIAYLLSLPAMETFEAGGRALVLFVVFLTEINDVLQFIFGKLFGNHKIIPKVSPNKTWEGFLGGFISSTAIGYSISFLTPLTSSQAILVSALVAFAGFVGDVVVSTVKRDIGLKDTGTTIPGHGGILDRIDSLAYTAPVFFHLVYYLAY
jgi:phosphatidate cytidylyltransferase